MGFLIHGLGMPKLGMGFLIHGFAWPASFRAFFAAFVKYVQRDGLKAAPFVDIVENAAKNDLNDAAGCWLLAAGCSCWLLVLLLLLLLAL